MLFRVPASPLTSQATSTCSRRAVPPWPPGRHLSILCGTRVNMNGSAHAATATAMPPHMHKCSCCRCKLSLQQQTRAMQQSRAMAMGPKAVMDFAAAYWSRLKGIQKNVESVHKLVQSTSNLVQGPDPKRDEAKRLTDEFIAKHSGKPTAEVAQKAPPTQEEQAAVLAYMQELEMQVNAKACAATSRIATMDFDKQIQEGAKIKKREMMQKALQDRGLVR